MHVILQIEILLTVKVASFELDVFQVIRWNFQFLSISSLELIGLQLLDVVSQRARILILSLESHVRRYLGICIVEFIHQFWVDIFYLFEAGCGSKSTGPISFLWRRGRVTLLTSGGIVGSPQYWCHELLVGLLMGLRLAIIDMVK